MISRNVHFRDDEKLESTGKALGLKICNQGVIDADDY